MSLAAATMAKSTWAIQRTGSPVNLPASYLASSKLKQGWCELLGRYQWHIFLTLTFDGSRSKVRPSSESERLDRAFRMLIRSMNEKLYGRRWMSKCWHKGVIWARAVELHASGAPHFHAVIGAPTKHHLVDVDFCRDKVHWWRARHGSAKFEPVMRAEQAISYMIKHVGSGKSCEIDFSFNLPLGSLKECL